MHDIHSAMQLPPAFDPLLFTRYKMSSQIPPPTFLQLSHRSPTRFEQHPQLHSQPQSHSQPQQSLRHTLQGIYPIHLFVLLARRQLANSCGKLTTLCPLTINKEYILQQIDPRCLHSQQTLFPLRPRHLRPLNHIYHSPSNQSSIHLLINLPNLNASQSHQEDSLKHSLSSLRLVTFTICTSWLQTSDCPPKIERH